MFQFDLDLPEYRTHGGVHASDRRVTAPPIMWVKALDMLMEKLRILGVDFSKVAAISGAGQVCEREINSTLDNKQGWLNW